MRSIPGPLAKMGARQTSKPLDRPPITCYSSTVQHNPITSMDHFLLVDTVTGTILNPAGCNLVNPDHLLDEDEYSDSEAAEIAKEHGTPISADYNLVQCVVDALWGKDADKEWGADTLSAIAEAVREYRPDLIPAPHGLTPVSE